MEKLKYYIDDMLKKEKLEIFNYGEDRLKRMVKKYKEKYNFDKAFTNEVTQILENAILDIEKIIITNININEDNILLKHYMDSYPDILELIINNSDDFIDDLNKLKYIDIKKYCLLKKSYLDKYPNECDRPISDIMFNIIDEKKALKFDDNNLDMHEKIY